MLVLAGGCYLNHKAGLDLFPSALNFQMEVEGKCTDLFILRNSQGMSAAVTNYGARLVSLVVPGRNEEPLNVVIGFDSLSGYIGCTEPYFGAMVGGYANRIEGGGFSPDVKAEGLSVNNGPDALHGMLGFGDRVWETAKLNDSVLVLTFRSKDGDYGFPGNLLVKVIYSITSRNELGDFGSGCGSESL